MHLRNVKLQTQILCVPLLLKGGEDKDNTVNLLSTSWRQSEDSLLEMNARVEDNYHIFLGNQKGLNGAVKLNVHYASQEGRYFCSY